MKEKTFRALVFCASLAIAVAACRSVATLDSQSRDEIEQLYDLVDEAVAPDRSQAANAALEEVASAERQLFAAVRGADVAIFAANRNYQSTPPDLERVQEEHRVLIVGARTAVLTALERLKNAVSDDEWNHIHRGLASIDYR
jgi:hypothetical protein